MFMPEELLFSGFILIDILFKFCYYVGRRQEAIPFDWEGKLSHWEERFPVHRDREWILSNAFPKSKIQNPKFKPGESPKKGVTHNEKERK